MKPYWTVFRLGVRSQLEYKANIVFGVLAALARYVGGVIFLWLTLSKFQSIQDWGFYEVLLVYVLSLLSWGLAVSVFINFSNMDRWIHAGDFDRFLLRPLNPFLHLILYRFSLFSAAQFLFVIAAVMLPKWNLSIAWNWVSILAIFAGAIGGTMVHGGLLILVSSLSFWTIKDINLQASLLRPTRELSWYPLPVYQKPIRWFLTYVIPTAFCGYIPALVVLKRVPAGTEVLTALTPLFAGLVTISIALLTWVKGLNAYQSTGT